MKRVLIITYYWPPSGGNGVQRWVKFVKYLRNFGWEPVIYTVSNGEYPELDHSLEKEVPDNLEVIRRPILEPYTLYKLFTGKKKKTKINRDVVGINRKLSFTEKAALWMRGNFFIPDARFMWIRPSVRFLASYLKSHHIDVMVSTGPPHTTHVIAMRLKQKTNIPWLADFRDPWTTMDYFPDLRLTELAFKKHVNLESAVLKNADEVISVGSSLKREFDEKRGRQTVVITNGFDESDFDGKDVPLTETFSICHAGSFLQRRNPVALWKVIEGMVRENKDFANHLEIRLTGRVESTVLQSLKDHNLERFLTLNPYVPHSEIIAELKSSQVLLLPIDDFEGAKWVLTGKLFEYLAAQRPVLCIGPTDGDAAQVISECKAGITHEFKDENGLRETIENYFEKYKNGQLFTESGAISKYSRRELTGRLAEVLNRICR